MNSSVVLLVLVLLAMASAQGSGRPLPQPGVVPRLSDAGSPRLISGNTDSRGTKSDFDFEGTKLGWQQWTGSLPNGAVSIKNGYTKSLDYICKHECDSGYYRPSQSQFCVYTFGAEARRAADFSLLVNKDEFEILEWKQGHDGSVAWNALKTCENGDKYVGKNAYGLGKVSVSDRAFYLPWGAYEYKYPKDYMFLTINEDIQEDHLENVTYHTEGINVVEHPPKIMKNDSVKNQDCLAATVTVVITTSDNVEHRWHDTYGFSVASSTTFKTGIPQLAEAGIRFSVETDFAVTTGNTYSETTEHTVSLSMKVPPNSKCRVHMVGKKHGADIPYTARLKRTYANGETKWTTITGIYRSVQISSVDGLLDRCERLSNVKPC